VQIQEIQDVVCRVGKLGEIGADDVLGEAGFSSMNALELLMEMETVFDITIPDDRFIEARTPRELFDLVADLKKEALV
jgi:acyl carrier protein